MLFTPKEEIEARLDKLRALMERASLDGAFFHYKIDYYYFSGTMQDALLFVPAGGSPTLFVKREIGRAEKESPLEKIVPMKTPDDVKPCVRGLRRIGMQLDVMPYNAVLQFKELMADKEFVNVSSLAKNVRRKKSPFEIRLMEKAAAIAKKVYARVPEVLHEGMREIEWEASWNPLPSPSATKASCACAPSIMSPTPGIF